MVIRRKAILIIVLILMGVAILYITIIRKVQGYILIGEMLANDCGEPRGGFEWVGLYNMTIKSGTMELKLVSGLGDPLEAHRYPCKVIEVAEKHYILLRLCNRRSAKCIMVNLTYYHEDPIWGIRDVYVAYYVDPTIFDGFAEWYYVELRVYTIIKVE